MLKERLHLSKVISSAVVPIPVSYDPSFEGERVSDEDIYLECGGGRTHAVEWVTSKSTDEVEDGKVELIGPDLDQIKPPGLLPIAIVVEVAGQQMQEDFEPILERQIHHLINYAQGVMHIGQRDTIWIKIGKGAVENGFRLYHLAKILHAKFHQDFGTLFDKAQLKIYTDKEKVAQILTKVKEIYRKRDARIEGMTDEATELFYSCTICQSIHPYQVCAISPERAGPCGAYNWLDCKVSYKINPTGPNQPIPKGEAIDAKLGQWKGVNEFVFKASYQKIDHLNLYSLVYDPLTTCSCCECIAVVLPMVNGVMTVNREYIDMTPSGIKFITLLEMVGGGVVTPGLMGHSRYNITQRKWLSGDGGIKRLVWMPKMLKEQIRERLKKCSEEIGIPDFIDMIADETIGLTEEEILPFLTEKNHPALSMDPILG
jgi:acetyl-CoA synthase